MIHVIMTNTWTRVVVVKVTMEVIKSARSSHGMYMGYDREE